MSIEKQPDEELFASHAIEGEVSNFPDLARGWGISFEQSQGIPPMEWFNYLFNRIDSHIRYLMQHGLPQWSITLDYPAGALVQYNGKYYRALTPHKGKIPTEQDSTFWAIFGESGQDFTQALIEIANQFSNLEYEILELRQDINFLRYKLLEQGSNSSLSKYHYRSVL